MTYREEKIEHLEKLKRIVDGIYCNQSGIEKLSDLINSELGYENPDGLYIDNIRQTIYKQLKPLLNSRKKPNNRIEEMKECKYHFLRDINEEIDRLKFR